MISNMNDDVTIVKYLIDQGASIDIQDSNGHTALEWGSFFVIIFLRLYTPIHTDLRNFFNLSKLYWIFGYCSNTFSCRRQSRN